MAGFLELLSETLLWQNVKKQNPYPHHIFHSPQSTKNSNIMIQSLSQFRTIHYEIVRTLFAIKRLSFWLAKWNTNTTFNIHYVRPTLKNCSFPITHIAKKWVPRAAGKTFFTLFKLNITYFKCYLHHNCSVNLNWNNTQLYSSAKPLRNVPSSVFRFVNFCFLPFLRRTSSQKWKKIWFCYPHKWIGKKEMSAKISECLCRNLFLGAATQIRSVYKDHEILVTLRRNITLPFKL